jgi:hypothetical protein
VPEERTRSVSAADRSSSKRARSIQNLVPFKKGFDARRNIKGRPKSFGQFRALAQKIAGELITKGGKKNMIRAEAQLREWLASKEPALQRAFAEYAFGKVPEKLEADLLDMKTTLILNYGHEKETRDADHSRLAADFPPGAD